MSAIFVFVFNNIFDINNNIATSYVDLITGKAKNYNEQLKKRYQLISNNNSNEYSIKLPALKNPPKTIYFKDISEDIHFWANIDCKNYWKCKPYIYLEKEEENLNTNFETLKQFGKKIRSKKFNKKYMKKKLVFATNNKHKIKEISSILNEEIDLYSLEDINCSDEIPETSDTIEGNALLKAQFIKEKYGYDCFADDTGLEIESLNNEPGVYSARYAGNDHNAENNMLKVLSKLSNIDNRRARFKTCIALIWNNKTYMFEGVIYGNITREKHGKSGFGYDPIFKPEGYEQTFAEMGEEIKNKISHRAIAVQKLITFLRSIK